MKQSGILARQTHRPPAGLIDIRHDLLVDPARQHHLDDFGRLAVGHPKTVDERGLDLQPFEHGADLRAAPVHYHRMNADLLQEHDVAGKGGLKDRIPHRGPAVLDDERVAGVPLGVRQRLRQRSGNLTYVVGGGGR